MNRLVNFVAATSFLISVIFMLTSFGCKRNDAPESATSSASGSPPPAVPASPSVASPSAAAVPSGPDSTLNADDLIKDLDGDSKAVAAKYDGKSLQVTGIVGDIGSPFNGAAIVRLGVGSGKIECWIDDPHIWGHVAFGQKVTIRGKADLGTMRRVIECKLIDAGPTTALITTAADMAAEYKADSDKFGKKYTDKTTIVQGDVAKKEADKFGGMIVWLKGAGELNVGCVFTDSPVDKAVTEKLNVGDHVKITGICKYAADSGRWLEIAKQVIN